MEIPAKGEPAAITVKVNIGRVDTLPTGEAVSALPKEHALQLSKSALVADEGEETIQLDSLQVRLESRDGFDTVSTTLNVAGIQNRQVRWSCFDSIPPRTWLLKIRSFSGNEVVHEGTGILRTAPEGVEVEINLVTTIRVVTEEITVAEP